MKNIFIISCFLFLTGHVQELRGQMIAGSTPNPELLNKRWQAEWITCPGISLNDYSVLFFRKSFNLDNKPASFIVNVSGDTRYRFFVNGEPACFGPAKGDRYHWYFETVDIASMLKGGSNTLSAVVWNFGEWTPVAQMSSKTGFILQGNSEKEGIANTNASWKVLHDHSIALSKDYWNYAGCGEIINGSEYPWGWEKQNYDDSQWITPRRISRGFPYGYNDEYDWILTPRDIPMMEDALQRLESVRRAEGTEIPLNFYKGNAPLLVPANRKVSFLMDQKILTTAYPEMNVSKGKGSRIKLTYCEALFNKNGKANRNDIEGRVAFGHSDEFYPDGGLNRLFRPLWFRTYRYIQVDIETKDEQLAVNDLYGKFTAYPFKENAFFESDDPSLKSIWDVGWRTARLCAHETYFDCPYYEQLQYAGDTRIQALISLYVSGDDRLMRKAIKLFDWSRSNEGITTSRYPGTRPQYIPPFSLYWVNIVHDYWMHRDDTVFVKSCFSGIKSVLEWYARKVDPRTGMLGPTPHWNYVDWAWKGNSEFPSGGVPPGGFTGGSSILTLQLAYTLNDAVELFEAFGEYSLAKEYRMLRDSLCKSTYAICWDNNKSLMGDNASKTSFSQHAGIMGILSGAVPQEKQQALFEKLNSDPSLIQATFYYRFYLFRALKKAGLAERYTSMLQPWKDMIAIGLSTFAETPEPTRSDCHAWSSSPLYDLLATVCGIEPDSPGFKSVKIEPHLGTLKKVRGMVPHPAGNILVELERTPDGIKGKITLPAGLPGKLVWGNRQVLLSSGANNIFIKST
jgi:alpha-L-rhamnosidase